jgi:hypothetical protein
VIKKPREGIEPPACVNETQVPPWQKTSLAQFQLRKFSYGTGGKHFNFLVSLGKKSWLELQVVNRQQAYKSKSEHEEVGQAVSARTFLGVDLESSSNIDT